MLQMKDFIKAIMIYKECRILCDTHLPWIDSSPKDFFLKEKTKLLQNGEILLPFIKDIQESFDKEIWESIMYIKLQVYCGLG